MMDFENFESALPAVVTSVGGDGRVDVRPCIRKVGRNGVVDLANPVIPSVPLMEFGGSLCRISFPAKKGDQVLLVATSRDSGRWKRSGADDVVPKSSGGNSLNDFVAVQVCLDASRAKVRISVDGDGKVTVECKEMKIDAESVKVSGELEVGKSVKAGGEVTANAGTLPVNLSTHTHMTAVGPSDPGKG